MSAADALLGANINEGGITNALSKTTRDIIINLGFKSETIERKLDSLYDLFPEGNDFDFMNDMFREARVITRTETGITLYLPYLDKIDLYSPDFSIYRDSAFSSGSLRIPDELLRQKVLNAYERIPSNEKGLFISKSRESKRMSDSLQNISQRSYNFLSAVNSLMYHTPWQLSAGMSVTDIIVYQYGDFYHFAVGDCFHPATYLLDIWHYLTVSECYAV